MGGAIQRRRLPTEQQHDHSIIDQRGKDACGLEALTRSHFTALRRRLEVYPPRSAQKQHGRKNSHNGVPENLLSVLVDNNRPTNKDRHARNSSWPGALCSTEGRIHLRRLVSSPSAFSLQSDGGPYIHGNLDRLTMSVSDLAIYRKLGKPSSERRPRFTTHFH